MTSLPPVQPSHHRLADAHALIGALPHARLRRLAELGDIRLFHRHAIILQEGMPGEDLVILLQGRLRVFSNSGGIATTRGHLWHLRARRGGGGNEPGG